MPELSLREAALRFQVSRATLSKDLARGKVSGVRDASGNWRIDAAELARVYVARPSAARPSPDHAGRDRPPPEPAPSGEDASLAVRLARAEAELAAEREKVALLERHLDDVRRLLPAPETRSRRRWWPW